ncbi:MAG: UDP-3-O-(3-hydroxymyristoyl)glucosamine N-acyltransferase [Sulfurovum sp.]
MGDVRASEIAFFLESKLLGKEITLQGVSALNALEAYSLSFCKAKNIESDKAVLILVPLNFSYKENSNFSVIKVSNPRLSFAKVLANFFTPKNESSIDESVKIGKNVSIEKNVSIGAYTVIGSHVHIAENTQIYSHVVIADNTKIGKNCLIKSSSVIGEEGFGFDFEEDGRPIRIPHLGNVSIGNNVEIGAKNTIARATLGTTRIENHVKIDDQVHIAHNCFIGENTLITACAEISGSVHIGKNCWIAPNVSIIQKVHIGDNVTIGIGAIVTKDIEANKKVMGLESLELRPLIKVKKRIAYGK